MNKRLELKEMKKILSAENSQDPAYGALTECIENLDDEVEMYEGLPLTRKYAAELDEWVKESMESTELLGATKPSY